MAICLLSFPLLLWMAFVFPSIAVGTHGFIVCMLCRWSLLYSSLFLALGMSFCCTIKAFGKCPSVPIERAIGQHHVIFYSVANRLHSSGCCYFFSATLSIHLVSEESPSSTIQIFLGLPIVWVGTVALHFVFASYEVSQCHLV